MKLFEPSKPQEGVNFHLAPPLPWLSSTQNNPSKKSLSAGGARLLLACIFLWFCAPSLQANNPSASHPASLLAFFPPSFVQGTVLDFDGPVESGQTWYLWQVKQQANESSYLFWVEEDDASGHKPSWRLLRPRLLRVTAQQIYLDQLCLLQTPLEPGRSWSSTFWTGEAVQVELVGVFADQVEIAVTQLGPAPPQRLLQVLLKNGYGVLTYSWGEGHQAEFSRYWLTRIGQLRAGPVPADPVEPLGLANMVQWQVILDPLAKDTRG